MITPFIQAAKEFYKLDDTGVCYSFNWWTKIYCFLNLVYCLHVFFFKQPA